MKRAVIIYLFVISATFTSFAQEAIRIIDYDYSKYPEIENLVFVFDNNGNPVLNLNTGNFNIRDNGVTQANLKSITCDQSQVSENVSYTIVYDLGLDNYYHNPTNFSLGRQTANRLINLINTDESEISLTSYDYRSFLNREFTSSKADLLAEVAAFQYAPGSLFEAAFIDEPAGAFKINSRAENDAKSIILITDGGGKYDFPAISAALAASGAKLFVISLRKEPQTSVKELCSSSGGMWFELSSQQKVNSVVYSVLAMSKGYKPCKLNWTMDYSCEDNHNIEIIVPSRSVRDEFKFEFNNFEKSIILSDPEFLAFSSVDVGTKKSLSVTLTAKNRDILIQELRVKEPFKIINGNVNNYLLLEDEFISVTIEYTPEQEAIVFSPLEIVSDACMTMPIYMTGGFPNTKPTEKTIKIVHPNGGEYLIIGDTSFVEWLGLLPLDVIQLEYSTDNGRTWLPLAINVDGLKRDWIVPDTPSDSCLVKIIQLWPNNVGFTLKLPHKGAVNSAFFNPDGDLVLTASSDTTAAVWIANTGVKKFNLQKHNKPIQWAVFDPLNEFIATGSMDSTVMIWSQEDGSLVHVIEGHSTIVESVNFSNSGQYLVSSDFKGYSIVRDRSWNILKTIKANEDGPSWYTEFHPLDEDYILSANGDGMAKEWNWRQYSAGSQPTKVFETKSIMCKHATYSTNGSKVAATTSSGNPKKLYVWDVNDTENYLYEISHNLDTNDNNSINYSSFFYHPDLGKEVLLTTSTDETARLWDAADGTPTRINDFITDNIFRYEHTNSVTTGVFDRFGSRLLTASWDSTAKIWNLNQKELQQDISDSVFTIAYARGKGMTVDMGTVYLGELKDSIVRAVFVNESKFAYNIRGYKFSGTDAGDFEILTDLKFPMLINANDSLPLEIRYFPKQTGFSTAELEFELPAGVVVKSSVSGLCDLTSIKLNYPIVDFGKVEVGSFKDSTFTLIMTNESGAAVEIDEINVIGSYKTEFTSNQNVGTILQNGESIPVTLRFLPEYMGRKNAQYSVNYKGKGSPRLVNMFGEGTDARSDSLMIYVKSVEAYPGDIIQVPIYVGAVGSLGISDFINGFSTNMRFNATLLEPLSGFSSSEIIGNERILKIDLPKTFSQDSVLHILEFKALWGNDTISPLILEYTVPSGAGRISITEESAHFKLLGVCLQDGELRLFLPGDLSLSQNQPNPAQDITRIDFSVLESGNTRIVLSDMLGNDIKVIANGNFAPGQHSVHFHIGDLPPGVYYYTMYTPTNVLRKSMLITK
ncbi:MAG: choice-of-anchor D domain-containing protein [Candidatus Kapabacteria bacterium]|nr:choice-of-anchor D domain-containing protein [Ignavibacteriota bacterium]MCW5886366.1 choice-of-anchor D domain-containing protein [Candidatus Kapabacteria bacterium]